MKAIIYQAEKKKREKKVKFPRDVIEEEEKRPLYPNLDETTRAAIDAISLKLPLIKVLAIDGAQ